MNEHDAILVFISITCWEIGKFIVNRLRGR